MLEQKLSIVLLARSLEVGGAERQLVELAKGLDQAGHQVRVALFYKRGPLCEELDHWGIAIVDLGKAKRWDLVNFLARTALTLKRLRPDIVYSFLGGANIVAAALRPLLPTTHLVWSIRASNMDLGRYDWTHRLGYRIERAMSGIPDLIIANSSAGRDFARGKGFPAARIRVIRNGIDIERFKPDAGLRSVQRQLWGIGETTQAIGILARLDPMKGHSTFIRAAALVARERQDLCFLCIGDGPGRTRLETLAGELDLGSRIAFTGQTSDPAAALNGLDLACSASSFGEGFSNSIAEAMACGTSCVVTDVGDSAIIVGDLGGLVPPDDPEALAAAMLRELKARTPARCAAARRRIVDHFSARSMSAETLAILQGLAGDARLRKAARSLS